MATEYDELTEAIDPGLILPIRRKRYHVPAASWEDGEALSRFVNLGLRLARRVGLDAELADDTTEESVYRRALGPVFDELVTDGIDHATIKHAGMTALWHHVWGPDQGRKYWQAGSGGVLAPTPPAPGPTDEAQIATPTAPPDAAGTGS